MGAGQRRWAYVCSPYRSDPAGNSRQAREYCYALYKMGMTPRAPHLLFPQFLNDSVPEERADGLAMARDELSRCSLVVVCGEKITEGMIDEIMLARRLRIPTTTLDGLISMRSQGKAPIENARKE